MYMHICKDMGFSSGVESKLKVGGVGLELSEMVLSHFEKKSRGVGGGGLSLRSPKIHCSTFTFSKHH